MQISQKALPFTIPKTGEASYVIQEERLHSFYPHLHQHEEIQICWIKKGRGTLIVQTELHHFEQGDVFIIASNRAHLFKNETTDHVEMLSLFFSADPMKNQLMKVPELKEFSDYFRSITSCNHLDNSIKRVLLKIQESTHMLGLPHFLDLLIRLLHKLPKETSVNYHQSNRGEDKMRQILQYTMENFTDNIDLKKMAALTNYSPEAFCRFFRKHTGRTYFNYLNDLRVNTAKQKIIQQEVSDIQSVAYESGFNNVSHFNRVFKKYVGCSPLKYKKQYFAN